MSLSSGLLIKTIATKLVTLTRFSVTIQAGADALALDRHHRTPLMCAAQSGVDSSAQILRDILDYLAPEQWWSAVNAVDKLGM